MKANDLVAGRWTLLAEAPGEDEVVRWRAVDDSTGEPVELLALRSPRAHSRSTHAAFAETHRRLCRATEPTLVRTLEVVDAGGLPVVVRAPLEDATLDQLTGRLPPGQVAALGERLLPAVVAAGSATRGALRPADIGVDARGAPILAPRARPTETVDASAQLWVAPEAYRGSTPDAAAGLFGLGVILYRLATGRDPWPPSETRHSPPPHPSALRPDIPQALDQALLLLLDADPNQRAGAMPLLQRAATELPDLRTLVSEPPDYELATLETGQVRYSSSSATKDVPTWRAAVVVPEAALARLEPAQTSIAVGLAGVPLSVLDTLDGRPLVLETFASVTEARQRALELRADLPVEVVGSLGLAALSGFLALAGLALTLLGVGGLALLLPVVGTLGVLFPVLGAILSGVAAGLVGSSWVRGRMAGREARRAAEHVDGERDRLHATPGLARAWGRLAALRRHLASMDLPVAAAADLRAGLKDLEAQLEGLGRIIRTSDEALSRTNPGQLRTRLVGLSERLRTDPSVREQRDRVARTIADLEEIEQQRERVAKDVARIEDALDEISATLGPRPEDEPAEDAVDRLLASTRLARETLDHVEATTPPRPRSLERE